MRYLLVVLSLVMLLCGTAPPADAQVSINIGAPGVSIGINVPAYPELVPVPGYPVYYAPRMRANYFFYDGLYWVYWGDNWYASSWYNGPWQIVGTEYVPLFVLRIPVRYYRQPPPYFRGWRADAPPRWGEHWGRDWEARHGGWDRWDRRAVPPAAPLPGYQRQYPGDRYPRAEERQHEIRSKNYRHQPREVVTQQHFQQGPGGPRPEGQQPHSAPPQAGPAGQQSPSGPPQMQRPQPGPQERGRGEKSDERGPDRR